MNDETLSIIKSTFAVMGITLLVKIFGFLEKVLLAYYFGAGAEVDAFVVAFGIILALFLLTRELIEPAFLPTFMGALKEDGEGWKLFSTIGIILFSVIFILFCAGMIYTPKLAAIFAPGFAGKRFEITINLLRISLLAVIFLSMSALTYITLNGLKRFVIPAVGDLVFRGCIIFCTVLLYGTMGIKGVVWGVLIGALGRLVTHLFPLRKYITSSFDFGSSHLKQTGILMAPLVIGVLFSQLSSLFDNIFASYLKTGSVAVISYARKIVEMPIIVFPYVLGIVIFPFFSQMAIEERKDGLEELLMKSLRWIALIFIPLSVLTILMATPVVKLLLERGAFTPHSTLLTSETLIFFALGMWAFATETILVQFYFACFDTKTPIFVGIVCVVLNVILTFVLVQWGAHKGIALALSLSKTTKVIILLGLLHKKIIINFGEAGSFVLKISGAALSMGIVVGLLQNHFYLIPVSGTFPLLFYLIKLTIAALMVYILIGSLFRIEELFPSRLFKQIWKVFPKTRNVS